MRVSTCLAALALLALAMMSCGGSGDAGPPATPTITPTATGAGFLATWTPEPTALDTIQGPLGSCPPQPRAVCVNPGDIVNAYRLLPDSPMALHIASESVDGWVLDPMKIEQALRMLDDDVIFEPYAISGVPGFSGGPTAGGSGPGGLSLTIYWARGEGLPWGEGSMDIIDFGLDADALRMGHQLVGVQWPVPAGFVDALFASFSDATPTPSATVPYYTPVPTPTIVAPGTVRFAHPESKLVWDGPDARVTSYVSEYGQYVCGNFEISAQFGVPISVLVHGGPGFYLAGAVRPPVDVQRKGYFHGGWQIWQGTDPGFAYVFREGDPIAFEYRTYECIIF